MTPQIILSLVAEYFSILPEDLNKRTRITDCFYPRWFAWYFLKNNGRLSLKAAAIATGGWNHSSVLHALKKIKKYVDTAQQPYFDDYNQLSEIIKNTQPVQLETGGNKANLDLIQSLQIENRNLRTRVNELLTVQTAEQKRKEQFILDNCREFTAAELNTITGIHSNTIGWLCRRNGLKTKKFIDSKHYIHEPAVIEERKVSFERPKAVYSNK